MSVQKVTSSQETSAVASYKAASHEKSYKTSHDAASQAAYQAAKDSFARSMWNSISKIPTFWNNRNFTAQYKCLTGLTFGFHSHQNKCYIEISLAHLTKEKIVKLLKKGKLNDELLTLFELAHLPFAEYCLMNIDGLGFDIIDYVKLRLDLALNPKDYKQYGKHWKFMLSRDQLLGILNR
ncbi:MAG: hypothetical protein GQ545_09175, partial [Candidatus Aminicenantes bacterium]|nr:hypothetical protein [Candidatus Aminicenantes bacterium]